MIEEYDTPARILNLSKQGYGKRLDGEPPTPVVNKEVPIEEQIRLRMKEEAQSSAPRPQSKFPKMTRVS